MTAGGETQRIAPQDWMTAPATARVVGALQSGGAKVRFVGGCVRDALVGRAVKDIDLGTPEPPETAMQRLKDAGIQVVPTGIEHGTITAVVERRPFEITSLRRDVTTDGRRAVVAFTDDWREDAARRDFTFNAMSCAPDGVLYDYFGGLDDLKRGRVRFVGDAETRIREDVLRLLRFFRFNAHYGKPPLDAAGLAACRKLKDLLPTLSGERLAQETSRLLAAADPAPIVELMLREGVLPAYLPEAKRVDRLKAIVDVERAVAAPDALRRLAAMLEGAAAGEAVASRLRLSNSNRERLMLATLPKVALSPSLGAAERRRAFNRLDDGARLDAVLLAWAAAAARADGGLSGGEAEAWSQLLKEAQEWRRIALPVKGRDALALGMKPGPAVGALIDALEAWWEAGDFKAGREQCLKELKRRVAGGK